MANDSVDRIALWCGCCQVRCEWYVRFIGKRTVRINIRFCGQLWRSRLSVGVGGDCRFDCFTWRPGYSVNADAIYQSVFHYEDGIVRGGHDGTWPVCFQKKFSMPAVIFVTLLS